MRRPDQYTSLASVDWEGLARLELPSFKVQGSKRMSDRRNQQKQQSGQSRQQQGGGQKQQRQQEQTNYKPGQAGKQQEKLDEKSRDIADGQEPGSGGMGT